MFSLPARKSNWARCRTCSRRSDDWKAKSNSSIVLRAGKRAALILDWPPWLSRLSVSVFNNAAANCSKDHSSARARSAQLRQRAGGCGCFELAEQVRQFGRWAAHAISAS